MNKIKNKISYILLSYILVIGLMPSLAYANDLDFSINETEELNISSFEEFDSESIPQEPEEPVIQTDHVYIYIYDETINDEISGVKNSNGWYTFGHIEAPLIEDIPNIDYIIEKIYNGEINYKNEYLKAYIENVIWKDKIFTTKNGKEDTTGLKKDQGAADFPEAGSGQVWHLNGLYSGATAIEKPEIPVDPKPIDPEPMPIDPKPEEPVIPDFPEPTPSIPPFYPPITIPNPDPEPDTPINIPDEPADKPGNIIVIEEPENPVEDIVTDNTIPQTISIVYPTYNPRVPNNNIVTTIIPTTPIQLQNAANDTIVDEEISVIESIEEESTPLAESIGTEEPHICWIHWLMIIGIIITCIYALGVIVYRYYKEKGDTNEEE